MKAGCWSSGARTWPSDVHKFNGPYRPTQLLTRIPTLIFEYALQENGDI